MPYEVGRAFRAGLISACYRESAVGETQLSVLDVVTTIPPARHAGGRLVVLIPRWSSEGSALPPRLEPLAASGDRPVVFVGLAETAEAEARLRRRFAGYGNDAVSRQLVVVRATDWSTAIDAVHQDGDVIVFPSSDLSLPATMPTARASLAISPLAHAIRGPWLNRLVGSVLEWAGPLLIVAGFFFVQVRIDQAVTGAVHSVLLAASVLVEIAVLWRWEQWTSGRLGS